MKTIVLIPARGGSKSIPYKNIKLFNGKPLIAWSITEAKKLSFVDEVYVSTDSKKIALIAEEYGAKTVSRSDESATDGASTESCMIEFAQQYDFDNIILLQATSPLTTKNDIYNAFFIFDRYKYDSVLSVVEFKRFIWEFPIKAQTAFPLNYNPLSRPRRQDMEVKYIENGAIYITKRNLLLENKCRISGRVGLSVMDQRSYFELDEPEDWVVMEKLHD